MINLLLVEDNALVRKGIIGLFKYQEGIEVIGDAADGLQALKLLKNGLQPDIILADLNMPEMDGIELTKKVSKLKPSCKVIILTMHAKQAFIDRAFEAGAKGYLLKNGNFDELFYAIRQVNTQGSYISAEITN